MPEGERVCVFIDGENFRNNLQRLYQRQDVDFPAFLKDLANNATSAVLWGGARGQHYIHRAYYYTLHSAV